jgi:cytochrome c-type biogenesis protein CcmH/NrfG
LDESKISELQARLAADGADVEAHFLLGSAYLESGRFMEAVASLRRSVELDPDYADAWMKLGDAYEKAGIGKEAKAARLTAARVAGTVF